MGGRTSEEAPAPEAEVEVTEVEDADPDMPDIPAAPKSATRVESLRR